MEKSKGQYSKHKKEAINQAPFESNIPPPPKKKEKSFLIHPNLIFSYDNFFFIYAHKLWIKYRTEYLKLLFFLTEINLNEYITSKTLKLF